MPRENSHGETEPKVKKISKDRKASIKKRLDDERRREAMDLFALKLERRYGIERRTSAKASREELEQRIVLVARLLTQSNRLTEIYRIVHNWWGISRAQAKRYVKRARKVLLESSGKPRNLHVAEVVGWYEEQVRDPDVSLGDKIRCLQEKCRLLGLYSPVQLDAQVSVSSKTQVLAENLSVEEMRILSRVWEKQKMIASGQAEDSREARQRAVNSRIRTNTTEAGNLCLVGYEPPESYEGAPGGDFVVDGTPAESETTDGGDNPGE